MKYIFDFDDVLFLNTAKFKKHMYTCIEKAGVSHEVALKYYNEVRDKGFSMRDFVNAIYKNEKDIKISEEELYKEIMHEIKNFINQDLLNLIKGIGKENCYIVTHGKEEYQLEKIDRTSIAPLFCEIIVVQDSKKQSIENICAKNNTEKVVFVDDKEKRFKDLDFEKFPNLKTILYTGQDIETLRREINS
ncbi:HAD hydrolase-like protein [Candidatus Nomurabacteria bacterium]|nr:HAD hydrolase-like protein [Candidatus Nomurabacteria bacterium]